MSGEEKDPNVVRMNDLAAMVAVHFPNFLIVLGINDGYMYQSSDKVWALGGAELFAASVKDQALIRRIEQMERDED